MDCTNDAYTVQPDFVHACKLANTPPTRRQASRFRMGKGRAYKVSRIIPQAPPVPFWFEPAMGSDTCPPEIEANETRNREILEWRTRYRSQRIAQWPKAWAFRSLGIQ